MVGGGSLFRGHFLRFGCLPGLHLLEIRRVNTHHEIQRFIAPIDGQPVFLRDVVRFFNSDVNLNAAVLNE
jgi:hypothetical protein